MPVVSPDLESQISAEPIAIQRLGTRDYLEALAVQRKIHLDVTKGLAKNTLLIVEHPSVYTAGRRTLDSEKPTDGTPVIDVDRGVIMKTSSLILTRLSGLAAIKAMEKTILKGSMHFLYSPKKDMAYTCQRIIFTRRLNMYNS